MRQSAWRGGRHFRALDAVPLHGLETKPEDFISSTKPLSLVPRGGAAIGYAHRLLDHHESAREHAHAAAPLGVGLELLLHAGGDIRLFERGTGR